MNLKAFAADPMQFFDSLIIPSASGPREFREVMAPFQRSWFQAIAPSLLAVAAGEQPPITRFWSERTKGGSKDSDAAAVLLFLLAFSRQKLDCQCGAADRDQALELKKAAADILRLNGWLAGRIEVQSWSLLCRATGSECTIISSDVASSHGARPDIVILNELSHITREEFAANLLDNASKKPQGLVVILSNAGLVPSWQYNWRETFRKSDRWHFHAFSEPAPWLAAAEIEEAQRRNSRARWQRLYWGAWVSASGDALDQADIDACTDSSLAPMGRVKGWFYVAGLDLGVRQDHSGLVVVAGNRSTQQLQLAYAEAWAPDPRTGKVDLVRVEQVCLDMHRRYGLTILGADPYQAELMMQRLALQRVKTKEVPFVGKNLNEMASTLLDVFRSRRITLYNHRPLIDDLGRLSIVEKAYGHRLEATHSTSGEGTRHCDLATALAIVLPIAVEELGRTPFVVRSMFHDDAGLTPYESALQRELRRSRVNQQMREWEDERAEAANDHKAELRQFMRQMGR